MGYIAPVTNYNYIQYVNRTVAETEQTNRYVGGTAPIRPFNSYLDSKKETEGVEVESNEITQTNEKSRNTSFFSNNSYKKQVAEDIIRQTATKLTGKGWFVNEMV